MKNKLITIGYMGNQTAYLNLSQEEAINRFLASHHNFSEWEIKEHGLMSSFEFDDSFSVYDAWE